MNIDEECPGIPVYVRGDSNLNPADKKRLLLSTSFLKRHNLFKVYIPGATYHHFLGEGASDSPLDILLYRGTPNQAEILIKQYCVLDDPLLKLHHDSLVSSFPLYQIDDPENNNHVEPAPTIKDTRVKILLSIEGNEAYQNILSDILPFLRSVFCVPESTSLMSLLIQLT